MLHTFQALNYLFKKDIENAAPEVRLAGDRQKADLDAHDKELEKQREKSSDKSNADAFKKVSDAYAGLDESAGKVKNAFQNAYAFYVSALVYEAHNEPDQAYKDYQNALEIFPENVTVQRDTIRLAKALAYTSDLAEYKKRFPQVFASVEGKPKSDGSVDVVVLFEDGLIPQRKQIKIPLPVNFKGGFTAVSWPTYTDKWIVPKPLSVSVDGGDRGQTDPIVYLQAIAAKALKDEIVGRVIREIIRAAAKGAAAYAVSKDNNSSSIGSIIGTIATSAYNVASENADLRSWLTLPLTAQVKRFRVHAGKHTFTFSHPATGARGKLEVEVSAKKLQIVRVIRVGTQIYSSTVGL